MTAVSEAANILFYVNAIGKSHVDFTDSLIDSLVERGHTVDLIIARMNDRVSGNGKSRAERIYSFGLKDAGRWGKTAHLLDPFEDQKLGFNGFRQYTLIGNDICESALEDEELFRFISERKYDVGMVSYFDFCGVGILVKSGIPSVSTFSALPIFPVQAITAGLPNSQVVPLFHSYDLTTLEGRFWNLLSWGFINLIELPTLRHEQTELLKKRYGKSFDLEEVLSKIDLAFINSNEVMEKPRPIHHRFQYIGGINLRAPNPVNHHMDRLLSRPGNGTVIFSFGTQVAGNKYPRYAVRNFVNVFKRFPEYTFLWKYDVQEDEEQLFEAAPNVFPLDWLPQTDLLYDPRVVAFISHCGLNSFNEASFAGKPILAIPLFGDQPHNAQNGVARGTTVRLDKTKLSEESIEQGLRTVLFDKSFTDNARMLQKMLIEKPSQPKDRFVQWVEYSAANPGLHRVFELPGARMSIFEYYCVDAMLYMIFAAVLAAVPIVKAAKFVASSIRFSRKIKSA
ncbi:unnamed protein product [Caenorhabditis sp. 36 PRJEB53466]|nr:unnamed protein product [Caenorhabditis sp. 36 PRJEB53466]